ncbi:MAG: DUF1841 family protein [Woeseiaceae bacterium]|nr:DUF1841 family protein [Woeseiaceae bacterium]
MFGQNRDQLRRMYADAWRKLTSGAVLTPLESQIATVVQEHPEYHRYLGEDGFSEEFTPERGETNPFLHMGLHLAIREQVATDRPAGIAALFEGLVEKSGDKLETEHRMIDVLAEVMWESQRSNAPPDERAYLERLKAL